MKPPEIEPNEDIPLFLKKALLGQVTPALRGVTVGWDESMIRIAAYYDKEITELDRELMEDVELLIMADFSPIYWVELVVERYDAPLPLSEKNLGMWVFRRFEEE